MGMDVLGEIVGNKIRISIPSLIDNWGRNLIPEVVTTLEVVLLHELSHWAHFKNYGTDLRHSPGWNSVLSGVALSLSNYS